MHRLSIGFLFAVLCLAQDSATLTVTAVDPSDAIVPGAKLTLRALRTGLVRHGEINENGFTVFDSLEPGDYSLQAESPGFQDFHIDRLTLAVRDRQTIRVRLDLSSAASTKVVVHAAPQPVSSDAAQGVSLDQQYVQNLPANGRNAESLILMAPGISSAAGGRGGDGFNANGLRSNTNYFTLDGVSVNSPLGEGGPGPGRGGGPPALPGAGTSTGLINIDSMQEMKVQTSSFAPEFGRSPGAQVIMTSRGGTNTLHGALYYYKRNDKFDSNDWFANSRGLTRGSEHQDRPGGVLGGPIKKDRTFFFVSFEKLNLLSPQSIVAEVPDTAFRKSVPAALRAYVNAFPLPNGEELGGGAAEFRAITSNPSHNYAPSVRLDHIFSANTNFFVRYSLTSSGSEQRGSGQLSPNIVNFQNSRSQTLSAGLTRVFSTGAVNDLRLNWSASSARGDTASDNYGGAVPLYDSSVFPEGITGSTGSFNLSILGVASYSYGGATRNDQEQINVVDSLTRSAGKHNYKYGVDYRDILQTNYRPAYSTSVSFNGLEPTTTNQNGDYSLLNGTALNAQVTSNMTSVYPTYMNLSAYAQDTWRATDRTTVTYGLRWDLNPAPTAREGPQPFALTDNAVAGVTQNKPIYATRWNNLAPRFGVAYLSDDTPGREMMLRAGIGIFYDLGYGVVAGAFNGAPYSNTETYSEVAFPLTTQELAAPSLPPTRPYGNITTGAENLSAPIVVQWNGTWEKNFGPGQTLSVGVASSRGMNLMRTETQPAANASAYLLLSTVTNGASSSYNSMQIQYRRRMTSRVNTQFSYTWAHSVDDASNDAGMGGGFASLFGSGQRGSSDYDVRHNLSFSGSVRLPSPKSEAFFLIRDWNFDFVESVRSGLPFDIQGVSCSSSTTTSSSSSSSSTSSSSSSSANTACSSTSAAGTNAGLFAQVRPSWDGLPIWTDDPTVPGGKRLNKDAFYIPTGYQQGNLGRNSLRGFSFTQLDLSLRRSVHIGERTQLNIAAQGYNIFNHPNFANPTPFEGANMASPNFGIVTQMMNQSFGGGVNSLYRSGGARSMEFSLRLQF